MYGSTTIHRSRGLTNSRFRERVYIRAASLFCFYSLTPFNFAIATTAVKTFGPLAHTTSATRAKLRPRFSALE